MHGVVLIDLKELAGFHGQSGEMVVSAQDINTHRLEQQIRDLESRLDDYHRKLNEAIDHRDRVVLRRSWRFVDWLNLIVSLSLGYVILGNIFGWNSWTALLFSGVLGLGIALFVVGITQRREKEDQAKFGSLPTWEARSRDGE